MLSSYHYLSFDPGASNASRSPYLKALRPSTITVLLTLVPTVINVIHHSRSRCFSRAKLLLLLESPLALVLRLLLAILALIPSLLLVPGGSTPTNCIRRFYHNQSFISCAWRFYPDQLHLSVLPRRIVYFLCWAVLPRPTAPGGFSRPALSFVPGGLALIN